MELFQHQKDGLNACKELSHVAFYWDMGLGKTFAGSEKIMQLGSEVNLVVCQKSKIVDWMDHFFTYYIDRTKFDESGAWCYDLTQSNGIDYMMHSRYRTIIGVINYDLIWRRPELLKLKDFTLLLDESSLIQNDTAKRSKFIMKLNPSNVILLSGTPTGGKYENLWSQMHLLGWNISKELFLKQYTEVEYLDTAERSIPIVVGYKNEERLKRKMKEHGCQFLKTNEVFDLPAQIFSPIKLPVSPMYERFHKHKVVKFIWDAAVENACDPNDVGEVELVGDTTLTKMLYERQLCGMYSEEKLKAFEDLLESSADRFIVFYNFTAELEAMMEVCDYINRPYSIVNGSTKDLTAYEQHDDSVTFVQYQAGAMGLNLQKAFRMIFFTLPLSSELFEQSKKRIHRIGQKEVCFYYILICRRSIEEKILKTLEMRQDYTEKLFEKDDEF